MLKRNKNIHLNKKKKGQSTIEYIILVAAVLAVLLFFLRPGGPFATSFNSMLTTGTDGMVNMASKVNDSHHINAQQ